MILAVLRTFTPKCEPNEAKWEADVLRQLPIAFSSFITTMSNTLSGPIRSGKYSANKMVGLKLDDARRIMSADFDMKKPPYFWYHHGIMV